MEQVDLVHHNDDGALLFGQRLDEGREIALHEIGLAQVQIAVDRRIGQRAAFRDGDVRGIALEVGAGIGFAGR